MDVVADWLTMRLSGECSGSQVKSLSLTDLNVIVCFSLDFESASIFFFCVSRNQAFKVTELL